MDQCRLITEGRSDIQEDSSASVNEQLSHRFWNCKRSEGVTHKKKNSKETGSRTSSNTSLKKNQNCRSSLQETTNILQDIELSRLYLSTRSSWQPATNIQWSCTAKPVKTNGCKSQIDAENRQQSKESSLHLHYRKEKLSS
jgi:cytoskeletal protein RodZ